MRVGTHWLLSQAIPFLEGRKLFMRSAKIHLLATPPHGS